MPSQKERVAIRELQSLAERWPQTLGLFSWSGSLVVVQLQDGGFPENISENVLADIVGIPNDGGDPS